MLGRELTRSRGRSRPSRATHSLVVQAGKPGRRGRVAIRRSVVAVIRPAVSSRSSISMAESRVSVRMRTLRNLVDRDATGALLLAFAEWVAPNFTIDGFWTYVGATIVVWLVNLVVGKLLDRVRG